jgi:CheY-like chemotaxis protein
VLNHARILIVEDDPTVAAVCRDALEALGAVPTVVASTIDAVLLAASSAVDAVVCDVDLPNGLVDHRRAEVIAASCDRPTPLFVLSGLNLELGPRLAVAGYVPKPFSIDELGEQIAGALAARPRA